MELSLHGNSSCQMPRMEIDAEQVSTFSKTIRDSYFARKMEEAICHRGCHRTWIFVVFKTDITQLSCQGLGLHQVLDEICNLQKHFDTNTMEQYWIVYPGLRTVYELRHRRPRVQNDLLACEANICDICNRRGVRSMCVKWPSGIVALCLTCGEQGPGRD